MFPVHDNNYFPQHIHGIYWILHIHISRGPYYNQHVGTHVSALDSSSCRRPTPGADKSLAANHHHHPQGQVRPPTWPTRPTRPGPPPVIVARGKYSGRAKTQKLKSLDGKIKAKPARNIIDSWAARGLLPYNIHTHTHTTEGVCRPRSGDQGPRLLPGRFGADTRTWSWKFNDKTKCFCYVSQPHKGAALSMEGVGLNVGSDSYLYPAHVAFPCSPARRGGGCSSRATR